MDFYSTVQDDPELVAAVEDWKACLLDDDPEVFDSDVEGFTVVGPDSMYQLVEFEKTAATGQTITEYDRTDDGGTSWSSDGEPAPIPDDELEALRARELALWKLDRACQEDADIPGIQRRLQQRLADELKAEFPDLGSKSDG
jgi:hypothetical protein